MYILLYEGHNICIQYIGEDKLVSLRSDLELLK